MAKQLAPALTGGEPPAGTDASTIELIKRYRSLRGA